MVVSPLLRVPILSFNPHTVIAFLCILCSFLVTSETAEGSPEQKCFKIEKMVKKQLGSRKIGPSGAQVLGESKECGRNLWGGGNARKKWSDVAELSVSSVVSHRTAFVFTAQSLRFDRQTELCYISLGVE